MRSSFERYVPVVYFGLTVILIAALLPTALRPPQPPPPASVEFSPDAPPDQDHEVILSELARGTTTTAGVGEEVGVGGEGPGAVEEVIETAPRRGVCFGDPPRQAESIYAPPCAPAWQGDNGGATWQGVTENEVRIAVFGPTADEGRVPTEAEDGESDEVKDLRVFQAYFNERFELYNRRIQFYIVSYGEASADDSAQVSAERQRNAVAKADEEYQVFGIIGGGSAFDGATQEEAMRRELVNVGGAWQGTAHFERNAPFAWSFRPEAEFMRRMAAEMVCKQLGENPPEFNERRDVTFNYSEPRVYGIIGYQDGVYYGAIEHWEELLAECGLGFAERVRMSLTGDGSENMAGAVTRMRSAGVTTIVLASDALSCAVFTAEADNQNYFPEWVHQGTGGLDTNATGGLCGNRTQWRHTLGISATELPSGRPSGEDHYRAYKEIDPDGEPEEYGQLWFWQAMHMVGGIQLAGPELTPHTFQDGMHRAWPPRAPEPSWTVGGGYRPGKWTYTEYVALQWWDSTADRPNSSLTGAYRYPMNGARFTYGEIPDERVEFFAYDDPSHITEAPPEDRM